MPGAQQGSAIRIEDAHPLLDVDHERLAQLLQHVADAEGASIVDLSVVLADHEQVHALNRSYLEHDYLTDVLSFDLSDEGSGGIDGEIYVDLDTAMERHDEFAASFEEEAFRYAVHGLLHLIGYEDETAESRDRMRGLESHYLRQ